ncbi:MAG TPA: Mu-like prophage major head subunit gpT family protein [Rubrivivax sp.]|jgi:phage major head subunit gpT-like protein|nr:Mu-like prophage major head subunit gpT family protein [Rubrivivax sp.]
MLINRQNIADMFRGFQVIYQDAWMQAPSMYEQIATVVPSTAAEEHYGWLGTMPRMREWLGDRVVQSLSSSDYTIKNKPYEVTIGVDRDHIEDDRLGVYRPMIQMLAQEAKTHPDELVFGLLAAGFATLCWDGQYFFDTDHPVRAADGSMTTWSNSGGGAGTAWYLLDLSRPIKPLIFQKRRDYTFVAMDKPDDESVFSRKEFRYGIDARCNVGYGLPHMAYASKQTLDATNYAAARAALGSVKGDGGKVLAFRGTHLIVPPSLEKAGAEVLTAARTTNGADNVMVGTAKLVVAPWLA